VVAGAVVDGLVGVAGYADFFVWVLGAGFSYLWGGGGEESEMWLCPC
jgi:hypothetical protein